MFCSFQSFHKPAFYFSSRKSPRRFARGNTGPAALLLINALELPPRRSSRRIARPHCDQLS